MRQNGHPHTFRNAPLETEKGVEFQAEKNRMLDEIVSHNCTYSANQTMVDREVNDTLNAEVRVTFQRGILKGVREKNSGIL